MKTSLKTSSEKRITIADHLLTQTYPSVKEPKILLSVLKNLYRALFERMREVMKERLGFVRDEEIEPRFKRLARENDLLDQWETYEEARRLLRKHEDSVAESSSTKESQSSKNHEMKKQLKPEELRKLLKKTKDFHKQTEEVLQKC